ncbi:hypothetical protein [Streptomyces longispororuber]|uniref:hypothetical protein n=1 Tax=Streptomyces longispororuber TaxID=68230 RepID=UPI002108D8FF|nr:hypothetical protein [Streptomyces longispororuber]MCQ4214559.1 hypothetical protein [Streptomyces longispororuber]
MNLLRRSAFLAAPLGALLLSGCSGAAPDVAAEPTRKAKAPARPADAKAGVVLAHGCMENGMMGDRADACQWQAKANEPAADGCLVLAVNSHGYDEAAVVEGAAAHVRARGRLLTGAQATHCS